MKREASLLTHIPLKMFFYTLLISIIVYVSLNRLLENNFERELKNTATSLSSNLDWALTPLLESGDKRAVERLFEKTITNSMVEEIQVYDSSLEPLFVSKNKSSGSEVPKSLLRPLIEKGKLIERREDFSKNKYEVAIPIKEGALRISERSEDLCYLYIKMDFTSERYMHLKIQVIVSAITTFFFIILLLLNNMLIKQSVLTPLQQIKEGLKGVAKGRYDHRIRLRKEREVNDLIRVYNKMSARVQESHQMMEENRREAERLTEAKGAFLANMTHELRTPLNSIIGYSELLLEEEGDEGKNEKLSSIVGAGKHLLGIINNILDFSKMDAEKVILSEKSFELKKLLKSIEDLFRVTANQKGVDFRINIQNFVPNYFFGDEGRIKQIFINLISNAFKFTTEGYVYVDVSYRINRLSVDVRDSGMGIDENSLTTVFNSFEQVDINHKGTGLGLAITKTLCKMMKGDISVTSEKGRGTTFSFSIKLLLSEKPSEELSHKLDLLDEIMDLNDVPERRFKILAAEDVKENQAVLKLMLKKLDVDIDFADNGRDALKLYEEDVYDLLLLDIQMPVMNGLEVLEALRESGELENIYVIALTAYSLNTERKIIINAGASAILTKPLNKDEVRRLVAERLSEWRKSHEYKGSST